MPDLSSIGRSLLSSRTMIFLILFVIVLNNVQSKALRSSKSRQPIKYSVIQKSTKWLSWKFCGRLGDICKPDSRKHCCAMGLTCIPSIKQQYKKIRHKRLFGRCQPVPTIAMKNREIIADSVPISKKKS